MIMTGNFPKALSGGGKATKRGKPEGKSSRDNATSGSKIPSVDRGGKSGYGSAGSSSSGSPRVGKGRSK